MIESILWRRVDHRGHESARVCAQDRSWHLAGTAVFAQDHQPCRLDYLVACDAGWHTKFGKVTGWIGDETVRVDVAVDAGRRWTLNGDECAGVH